MLVNTTYMQDQLVWTIHNIYKVGGSNPTKKKEKKKLTQPMPRLACLFIYLCCQTTFKKAI